MRVHNPPAGVLVRRQIPHTAFCRAPQDDSVAPRHHVNETALGGRAPGNGAECRVIHFRLGDQHRELSLHWYEFFVAEERARSQARTVDDQGFVQRHEVARLIELPDRNTPTEEEHVAYEGVEVDRRLDSERWTATGVRRGKRMLPRLQNHATNPHVLWK